MHRALQSFSVLIMLSVSAFSQEYTEGDIQKRHTSPYPISRLHRDWMYQDHGLKSTECFVAADDNRVERAMVRKVLDELNARGAATEGLEKLFADLVEGQKPGNDPAWQELYFKACEIRRMERLKVF